MALFSLTVDLPIPALERKSSELAFIERALALAVQDVRSAGGAKTSGNILNDGATVIGSWVYSSQAA
ncbi:hypothetical protein [Bradyrhizobium erythrophlei]|uniref:Uncharacterized protein n=1 Tax=Bradyrhizobium erythrophlei TaxID=1437360 RepID=A0A1M5QSS3_9BRAD|nr:hypothetical protein [Bradyrhizobium erythrophlei]SHH17018.1 hypothetical protein SAMN05443248_3940 [Bradyrhizobium erythrophlei]